MGVRMTFRNIELHGGVVCERPHRFRLRPDIHQHAADVRMVDDCNLFGAAAVDAALDTFLREIARLLIGPFGDGDAL